MHIWYKNFVPATNFVEFFEKSLDEIFDFLNFQKTISCGGSIESWWGVEFKYACAMWKFSSWNEFHGFFFFEKSIFEIFHF